MMQRCLILFVQGKGIRSRDDLLTQIGQHSCPSSLTRFARGFALPDLRSAYRRGSRAVFGPRKKSKLTVLTFTEPVMHPASLSHFCAQIIVPF